MDEARRIQPLRSQMLGLSAKGWRVRECWADGYYDGLIAQREVGDSRIEIYAGAATDGEYADEHYPPVIYVNDRRVADGLADITAAERVAAMRALIARASGSKATGGAA